MAKITYETTRRRVMWALLTWIFSVTLLCIVLYESLMAGPCTCCSCPSLGEEIFELFFSGLPYGMAYALIFLAPVWWLWHRFSRRGWLSAFIGNALIFSGTSFVLFFVLGRDYHTTWPEIKVISIYFLLGGVVGLIMWRIAYRREKQLETNDARTRL